jgi:hypothetical protein
LDTTAGSTVTGADLPTTDDADNNITVVGLGSSLTLGNGQADVIVSGAPGSTVDPADNSAQLNAGIVAEIPVVGSGVGTNYEVYDQDSPGWPGGAETNDRFGASLAAGDWSGDGVDDYAIGIPGEALGSIANAGAIEVKNSDDPNQFISQNSGNVLGGAEANDGFGTALSSGDFTGDGIPDVAVGVPGETVGNGPAHAGIVQLFSGQDDSSGLPLTDTDQTAAFLGFTYSTNANFGAALVVGHGGLVL